MSIESEGQKRIHEDRRLNDPERDGYRIGIKCTLLYVHLCSFPSDLEMKSLTQSGLIVLLD